MQKWRNFEFGQVQIDDAYKTIPKGMGKKILLGSHEIIKQSILRLLETSN